ncbi:MAG TPA: NAD-dependent malic enzyme [Planctomycetota bacterium]|jgi:malate dehydrogenase (oxaloacetate-decarboxylating)|nr:NAD-dependent malic enzyme [Planctomycetota bacterium]
MNCHHRIDPTTGQGYLAVKNRGRELLLDPRTNKGTGFPSDERDAFALNGLLPPQICSMAEQLARAYENNRSNPTPLARYVHMATLQDRNEVLFYRLALEHIDEMMPILYTPTVGEACQRFSHIYRQARGLFVDWNHRGRIADVLRNQHLHDASVIVVTDGERILGLGDQGVGGMGIPIGKLALYTLCAGLPPETTLPVMLDVGTDNEELLRDPMYIGLRRRRARGAEYQSFIDEFVAAVAEVFPGAVLQWEDFLKQNALTQLERFRDRLPSFNDDIQGTAAVTLAGLLAALRMTAGKLADQRLLFGGAGASAQGIASLFVAALMDEGVSKADAHRRVFMVDRSGLVHSGRADLEGFKSSFARPTSELGDWRVRDRSRIGLLETIDNARPTILVGTSATPGFFDEACVRAMASHHARPIVFPLSNPTSKCECTAEDALRWSDGRALVATGSPFAPVEYGGRRYRIGQCNNSYIFPGIGLGAWVGRLRRISDGMFLDAARTLASKATEGDFAEGSLFPKLEGIRDISHAIACAVVRRGVSEGHGDAQLLDDLEQRVRDAMWFPRYLPFRAEE